MNDFISKLDTWITSKPIIHHSKQQLNLKICLKNQSLNSSYIVFEDLPNFSCIPINSELVVILQSDSLILIFTQYDDIQLFLDFPDVFELELIYSHLSKSSILFNKQLDSFKSENLLFLKNYQNPSVIKYSSPNDSGGYTNLTPISTTAMAKSIWGERIISSNTQFFTKFEEIRFSFLTWNVAGHRPQEDVLSDIVRTFKVPTAPSDIIIIAFQEIDMSVKSVVTGNSGLSDKWTSIVQIAQELFGSSKLELVASESVGSVYCAALIRKGLYPNPIVGPIETIKLGIGGIFANKAAIFVPIKIGEAKIMTVCCHLAPHEGNVQERNEQWKHIVEEVGDNFDHIVMIGDLNYRVTLHYDEVIEKINQNDLKYLLEHDQLSNERKKCSIIGKFNEPEIKFKPTYKFDKNCDIYDTSPKHRIPSWTDRVLIKTFDPKRIIGPYDSLLIETDVGHHYLGDNPLFSTDCFAFLPKLELNYPKIPQCICYRSLRCTFSDHRPVHAAYKFKIPIIDQERLNLLQEIIEAKFVEMRLTSVPKLIITPSFLDFKDESNIEILLENKSLVWVNWSIKKIPNNCKISNLNGRLMVNQSININIEFLPGFIPNDIIIFDIKGSRSLTFKIKSNSNDLNLLKIDL